MRAKQSKKDAVQAIMERILSEPVPDRGALAHPLRKTSDQVTIEDMGEEKTFSFPADIKKWTARHYVDYFAQKYQEDCKGVYRRVYRSDCVIFQEILQFCDSNGLEKNEWTRRIIDWAFVNRERISRHTGHFTPAEIRIFLNYFYQEEIMAQVELGKMERIVTDTSLLQELNKTMAEGRVRQVFINFGIPVAATYMSMVQGMREELVVSGITQLLSNLSKGSPDDRHKLAQIFRASIVGSPYPDEFFMRDWRVRFVEYTEPFVTQDWWRNTDYRAQPLAKYQAFLSSECSVNL